MHARIVDLKLDYPNICHWWSAWDWPAVPLDILPPTGFIVSNKGADICAAWLYLTNSRLASIEWIISNRDTTREQRAGGIEYLFEHIAKRAKEAYYSHLITNLTHKGLSKRLTQIGYGEADTGLTSMIKIIE